MPALKRNCSIRESKRKSKGKRLNVIRTLRELCNNNNKKPRCSILQTENAFPCMLQFQCLLHLRDEETEAGQGKECPPEANLVAGGVLRSSLTAFRGLIEAQEQS